MNRASLIGGAARRAPRLNFFDSPSAPARHLRRRISRKNGFTLIELVVVMSLIGVMLGFAAPQLKSALFVDGTKKASRWLMVTLPSIKTKAVREQKIMALGVSIDQDKVWVIEMEPAKKSDAGRLGQEGKEDKKLDIDIDLDEEETGDRPAKKPQVFEFPSDVHIMDVEFPDQDRISVGETEINFYPKGYSDHAIIHVEDNEGNRYSFLIEPFLPNIKRIDDYVKF